MKEREPTHSGPHSAAKKDRPAESPEFDPEGETDDRTEVDDGHLSDAEKQQYDSLSSTRITSTPLGDAEDEDVLVDVNPTPTSTPSSKRTNTVLGDFQLVRKLGQGAMATVYKARQISFDRKVALKLLHKHVADNPKLVERFYREARSLGQLDHPNIVQGYGVDEIEGFHCFAMEYIAGVSLQVWLNKLKRIPVSDALRVAIDCARALEYAHKLGLVHRDIKPDNIMITRTGEVKVADLGMVKALDEDMSLTQTGHAVGTPWYMPLEQAKNAKDVDGRCDIYALGCMLYCMVTGNPPFRGGSIVDVIQAKEIGTFPPARQSNPDVPERLDLILVKMTAKLAKHRYQNCGEVIRDLEALGLASAELEFVLPGKSVVETQLPDLLAEDTPPVGRSGTVTSNQWYVRLKTTGGDLTMKKFSTNQLYKMLESGQVSPNIKISRSEDGPFRSLATFKEFESIALALATRSSADKQTSKYRELYKKLDEEDLQHREKKQVKQKEVEEKDESLSQALRVALPIAGAVVGGILVLWLIISLVRWMM